jgi:hypothetical protein
LIGTDNLEDLFGIYTSAIDPEKKANQVKGLPKVPNNEPDIQNTQFKDKRDSYFNIRTAGGT